MKALYRLIEEGVAVVASRLIPYYQDGYHPPVNYRTPLESHLNPLYKLV